MIVVSGFPRTGTSLQMLILKNLGLKIAGEKDVNNRPDLNPTGLWEVPYIVNGGLQEPIDADAIKIINKGLRKTRLDLISKLIYCIRDPREVVYSHRNLINYYNDEVVYNGYMIESAWMVDNYPLETICVVDFKDVIKNPKKQVKRIARYIGVPVTKKAIATPKKKYYRSKKHNIEPNELSDLCTKYYNYFKSYVKGGYDG